MTSAPCSFDSQKFASCLKRNTMIGHKQHPAVIWSQFGLIFPNLEGTAPDPCLNWAEKTWGGTQSSPHISRHGPFPGFQSPSILIPRIWRKRSKPCWQRLIVSFPLGKARPSMPLTLSSLSPRILRQKRQLGFMPHYF